MVAMAKELRVTWAKPVSSLFENPPPKRRKVRDALGKTEHEGQQLLRERRKAWQMNMTQLREMETIKKIEFERQLDNGESRSSIQDRRENEFFISGKRYFPSHGITEQEFGEMSTVTDTEVGEEDLYSCVTTETFSSESNACEAGRGKDM